MVTEITLVLALMRGRAGAWETGWEASGPAAPRDPAPPGPRAGRAPGDREEAIPPLPRRFPRSRGGTAAPAPRSGRRCGPSSRAPSRARPPAPAALREIGRAHV